MPTITRYIIANILAISFNVNFFPSTKVGVIDKRSLTCPVVLPKKDIVPVSNFPNGLRLGQGFGLQNPIPYVGPQGNLNPINQDVERLPSQVFLIQNIPLNSCALKDAPYLFR